MHELEKIYYNRRNITEVEGQQFSFGNMKRDDEIWDWIEESGVSVVENGYDKDGDYLVFLNKQDAMIFRLWLT